MKKNYGTPELEIFMISKDDVLTASLYDVNDPYKNIDAGWFA